VARPADALAAAAERAKAAGYECIMLGGRLQGEAREVAAEHAQRALALRAEGRRAVILSGGELTVTLRGHGQGGPNQEYALSLAIHLGGASGVSGLAADTDGTDGGGGRADDPAGAFVDDTTLTRAQVAGLDPAAFLADNNSTGFFNGIGDLFRPGPTFTNVTDFRAIVVDSP
jgi:glycerate 2-kinase